MKKILLIGYLICFAFYTYGQTTITTGYVTNTITFSTGSTYITFAVRNNNATPIILTNLTGLQADLYKDNSFELWYSATSLFGAPVVPSSAWSLVTSSIQTFNTNTYDYVTPFDCIGLVIPANTTYRFALKSNKGTCVAGGVTPNIFSAGGVDLLVGNNIIPGGQVGYFAWENIGNVGPYFFDGSITFAPTNLYSDVQVFKILPPAVPCNSTTNNISAQICSKSTKLINLSINNVNVDFTISGPSGTTTASTTLNTGTLSSCGCQTATVSSNIAAQGNYTITATANLIGATDINPANNTKTDSVRNYRPTVNGDQDVCQFANANGFGGFTSSGCHPSEIKKVNINCTVNTPIASEGTSEATASNFAVGVLPTLPDGAVITGGKFKVNNIGSFGMGGSLSNECRFNIYGPAPNNTSNPFFPGLAGNALSFAVYNFEYQVPLTSNVINNMYAALGSGGIFNIGYWETNSNLATADISLNAQTFPTAAIIELEYYINPIPKWYTASAGGSSIFNTTPFNPFVVPGSGINSTSTLTNITFYAACSADTNCRVPVTLNILPSPAVIQDTMSTCENPASSSLGIFDLTIIANNVSNNNSSATVNFYQDQGLNSLIAPMNNFSSTSAVIFSKVSIANGCFSSDSVLLEVHTQPQFAQDPYTITLCAPASVDVADSISIFSVVPSGTDTLYYEDALCTTIHPNPHNITSSDTVYIVFKTNTIPFCTDTAASYINMIIPDGSIAGQDTMFDVSTCNTYAVYNYTILDNTIETIPLSNCQKIVQIQDNNNNNISLGSTEVQAIIDCSIQYHNGQPYLNRHYKITPTTQDSAVVCLYFLEEDRLMYNAEASISGWPTMDPFTNLTVSKVDNGDITDAGHTVDVISNPNITASYNNTTTVWTICFPVTGFSYFYIHSQNPNNVALPVNIISFTGKKLADKVQLDWMIDAAPNAKYFEIERSRDGKNFEVISKPIDIDYKNNELVTNYQFVDVYPLQGSNLYRLKTTDNDGKYVFSKNVDVFFGLDGNMKIYPNPTKDLINIDMNLLKNTLAHIQILDVTGRMVKQMQVEANMGSNHFAISLLDLNSGLYTIKISNQKGLNYSELIRKN